MRLLLDSHVLLWWADGSPQLGVRAQRELSDVNSELLVSAANWWELSIKNALGRLKVDFSRLGLSLASRRVALLDVSFAHAEAVGNLPLHHRHPFDRMLIAQAQVEGLRLLTRDKQLKAYGGAVLLV